MPAAGQSAYQNKEPIDVNTTLRIFGEEFKDITDDIVPGVYNYYMISNYGRIYNKYTGNYMKPGISGAGYYFVYLASQNGSQLAQVHRLVLKAFAPIENQDNLDVNHKDGNKLNNVLLNLEWCTRSENILHAYETGLHPKTSIITEETAKEICELLSKNSSTSKEIAEEVGNGATEGIVHDIKQRQSWTNVSKDYTFYQRSGKLFTDEMINNICKYFSDNNIGDLSVNEHCRNALKFCNYEISDEAVDSLRKVYTRKYYTAISNNYDF